MDKYCKISKKCGGCAYQGIPYEEQLRKKETQVRKLLSDICPVRPIMGMEEPYHYRNKVHAAFARKHDGKVISGVYEEGTHRIVPVESCLIEDEKADAIIGTVRSLVNPFRIRIYNEDSGYGLLRHVMAVSYTHLIHDRPSAGRSGRGGIRCLCQEHPGRFHPSDSRIC